MSQLSYTSFVDGDQPLAAGFNSRFLLGINLLNSGIEADNIASNAITTAKIINDAVTSSKLAHPVLFEKSGDIASATTTDLSTATGNCVDITGTTTITAFGTVQAGSIFYLRFTGILTLTHNGTSLILPTGANITTQAGDCMAIESLGSGNWVCVSYQRKDGTPLAASGSGASIQTVNTQTGAFASGSTAIPMDDSIPQSGEGDQYMSLAITPSNASNKLCITVTLIGVVTGALTPWTVALFQDATAGALAAAVFQATSGNDPGTVTFSHYMTAGTTSATTFKVRAGGSSGTFNFNGQGGARRLGGVLASSITITEIKA